MINNLIAKEGKVYVLINFALFVFFLLIGCGLLSILFFIITVSLFFAFRNNNLKKAVTKDIVSPLNGKIYAIDKIENSTVLYVDICFFANSSIVALKDCKYENGAIRYGLNQDAKTYKATLLNRKKILRFDDIILELISGRCDIGADFEDSKDVNQYEKVGVFVDGIVKIIIPNNYNISVKIGDKLKIGEVL